MRFSRRFLPAVILIAALQPASASSIAERAAEIDKLLEKGEYPAAYAAAQEVIGAVWEQMPEIGFSRAVLTEGTAEGFGQFTPRGNRPYLADEPIHIYAEPVGFGYAELGDGNFGIGFDVDLTVFDFTGRRVAEIPGITEVGIVSDRHNREFLAAITYNLRGAGPGTYRLITTLRDQNSPRSGSFELAIEIAE